MYEEFIIIKLKLLIFDRMDQIKNNHKFFFIWRDVVSLEEMDRRRQTRSSQPEPHYSTTLRSLKFQIYPSLSLQTGTRLQFYYDKLSSSHHLSLSSLISKF
jgi:hypothetical protein